MRNLESILEELMEYLYITYGEAGNIKLVLPKSLIYKISSDIYEKHLRYKFDTFETMQQFLDMSNGTIVLNTSPGAVELVEEKGTI